MILVPEGADPCKSQCHAPVQYLLVTFWVFESYFIFPSINYFLSSHPSTEHHQGLNMYMRSSFFFAAVNKMHALLKETVWQGANYTKA